MMAIKSLFIRIFSTGLSRWMIRFTKGVLYLTFFCNFHYDDIFESFLRYKYNLQRSNVTIPYVEIGASLFNNNLLGLLLWRGLIDCFLNFDVFEILWTDYDWFSLIFALLQCSNSQTYCIKKTTYGPNYFWESIPF